LAATRGARRIALAEEAQDIDGAQVECGDAVGNCPVQPESKRLSVDAGAGFGDTRQREVDQTEKCLGLRRVKVIFGLKGEIGVIHEHCHLCVFPRGALDLRLNFSFT
jgi:hypothetical protein